LKLQPKNSGDLNGEELAWVLRQIPIVRAWADAVEAEGLERLVREEEVPGFKLVEGRTHRIWNDEAKAKTALLQFEIPLDEVAPRELVSPAGAEKLTRKYRIGDLWESVKKSLIKKPRGKYAIAPVEDPREAIQLGHEFKDD
jgi:hypothetical protein